MNCDLSETSVCKIQDKNLFLKIKWKNDEDFFHIKVFKDNVWTGVFTNNLAEQYSEVTEETLEDYQRNVKEALCTFNPMYLYDFTDGSTPKFVWKKKFEGTSVTMEHGSVLLQRDENASKDELLDFLLDVNSDLNKSLSESAELNLRLKASRDECKKELEKHCDIKASIESELYGKFIRVLNEKKRRIQLLEDRITES